ncbi:type I restriction-modification system subunit M N-terminal domain-containing protein [Deinococcus sp. QL22]|uniref:type I restriction-modification system subunit M N-terminal domain-containing protein n=1 Tax=Deinococcus sp. QL22 TaxID=2939437 RepID=UPI002018256D|nr:type I restriction-modification system subunit M N-terminal domain-containing protein [Deinococcus sp. QL22]UQN10766.1 type I restriction-modification system subunit M N-terminal domain-containing protein [Deinococcus sp. QL22]UQN10812.1 type I restriction-modification system subunit M N-terminal domain-containing protein [Deinococcus sp. QL22]
MTKAARTASHIEEVLWSTADQLRGHVDAAYKHVFLGWVSLDSISDTLSLHYEKVEAAYGQATAEDRDECVADGVFWMSEEARWDEPKTMPSRGRSRQADRRRHDRPGSPDQSQPRTAGL